ncbi:MAG: hypothetical protein ABEH65_05475 [Halobacteriales archaeon]
MTTSSHGSHPPPGERPSAPFTISTLRELLANDRRRAVIAAVADRHCDAFTLTISYFDDNVAGQLATRQLIPILTDI